MNLDVTIGTVALWSALGCLFVAGGAICGWLLGLTGFVEGAKGTDFRSSVRLKNFQYLVAGLVVTFAADYRKVGLGKDFPSVLPTASFALGAMAAYFVTVRNVRASIRRTVERWNEAHDPRTSIDVDEMVRLYEERGKPTFDARFGEISKDTERRVKEEANQQADLAIAAGEIERKARRARHIEANRAVSRCVYAVVHYKPRSGKEAEAQRIKLIESILEAACAAVRAHARRPDTIQLRGSFMRFVDGQSASPELRASALFSFGQAGGGMAATDHARYWGYLELQHGAGYSGGKRVVLPVESASADKAMSLPGAPEAAHGDSFGKFAIMNVQPTDRRIGIPTPVWDAIDVFFDGAEFRSITSICIHSGHRVLGVMNVESSERDLLGEDQEAAGAACASLQPVAALLSKFT